MTTAKTLTLITIDRCEERPSPSKIVPFRERTVEQELQRVGASTCNSVSGWYGIKAVGDQERRGRTTHPSAWSGYRAALGSSDRRRC